MITPDFTAFALRAHVHYPFPLSSRSIKEMMEEMMMEVTLECVREGADLIGHIKSVVETEGKGFLACSVVEPSGAVQTKGELGEGIDEIELLLNVLLYGLEREKVAEIAERTVRKELGANAAHLEMEDLEKKEAHEHHHEHC